MAIDEVKKKRLELFLRQIDSIRSLGMVNTPLPAISVNIRFSQNGISSNITGLNVDQFRSLLLGFRQFHNQNDLTHFYTVCGILEQIHLDGKKLAWVRAARKNWQRALKGCPSHYYVDGKPLTVEESIRLYFYGVLFHSDPEISAAWDQLDEDIRNFVAYSIRAALPLYFGVSLPLIRLSTQYSTIPNGKYLSCPINTPEQNTSSLVLKS